MITEDNIFPIGKIFKPHSYKGFLNVELDFPKDLFYDPRTPFFVKIDNIIVPFFVESIEGKGDKVSFIKFKGINSDEEAETLVRRNIYAAKSFIADYLGISEEELNNEIEELKNYEVIDSESNNLLGYVTEIEEGVEYDYISVKLKDEEKIIQIPMVDEIILEIKENTNSETGKIYVNLPEGFLAI